MKELVEIIVTNLITKPEELEIKQIENESEIIFEIKVSDEDVGRVIGKKGRIISAVRTVVKAASIGVDKNVMVEIAS